MRVASDRSQTGLTRLCPVCQQAVSMWRPGPGGRPAAACPRCGALERHRLLALLVRRLEPTVPAGGTVLDIAPTRQFIEHLRMPGRRYVGMDVNPDADGRVVTAVGSLTDLPLRDGVVNLAIVSHVLEHIPDDRAAMSELARALSPAGLALVQVPWRDGPTDEDPAAPEAERIRRFGQADHVRMYGSDFEDRLKAAGLYVTRTSAAELLPDTEIEIFGLVPNEPAWILSRAATGSPDHAAVLGRFANLAPLRLPDPAAAAIATLLVEAEERERRFRDLEERYRRLRRAPPVRFMVRIRKLIPLGEYDAGLDRRG